MEKIQFPGLNGIRFIAALLVIIDHNELFKSNFGYETLWANSYSSYIGSFGVTIFFVLSGFLITYLLLSEKKLAPINIKYFYFRRLLRIWPLYFLVLIIAFFIAPHIEVLYVPNYTSDMNNLGVRLLLFSVLLANIAFVYLPTVAYANILWSVAVEEQFYIFWPHIIKLKKNLFNVIILLLLSYLVIKLAANLVAPYSYISHLIERTRFSSMIIGGLGAYLVFYKNTLLKYIYNWIGQIIAIIALTTLFADLIPFNYFYLFRSEIISVVICYLIINIATNKKSLIKLENKICNYFGKISYGLYVYHLFAVVLTIKYIPKLFGFTNLSGLFEYLITLLTVLTISSILSHFSYNYFEKLFLRKKVKFSSILSGDMVNTQLNTK